MKISVRKVDNILYPVGAHSLEELETLPDNEYVIDIKTNRNPKFHRLAFSLLKTIFDNQDAFENFDLFRNWITMKAGYFIAGTSPNGKTLFIAESLSFEKMSQERFERWYSSVIDVAIREYGMDNNLLNQVLNYA